MTKVDVAIQCCLYDVEKIDNTSQYSGNQGQYTDLIQYIDYRDREVNNSKIRSVHPEYQVENFYSDRNGQNNKTTSSHYKNRQLICENNANPYILWNAQLRGRHDFNVGCRSRYCRRREQKVNCINQYSEHRKDKCENTNLHYDRHEQMVRSSHYQKGQDRQKTHTSLYHYSVCRKQAKNKCNQYMKNIESGKTFTLILINSDLECELDTILISTFDFSFETKKCMHNYKSENFGFNWRVKDCYCYSHYI